MQRVVGKSLPDAFLDTLSTPTLFPVYPHRSSADCLPFRMGWTHVTILFPSRAKSRLAHFRLPQPNLRVGSFTRIPLRSVAEIVGLQAYHVPVVRFFGWFSCFTQAPARVTRSSHGEAVSRGPGRVSPNNTQTV